MNDGTTIPSRVSLAAQLRWGQAMTCRVARGEGRYVGPVFVVGAHVLQRVGKEQAAVHELAGIDLTIDKKLHQRWLEHGLNGLMLSIYCVGARRIAYLRSMRTESLAAARFRIGRRAIQRSPAARGTPRRARRPVGQPARSPTTVAVAVAATLALSSCASKNKLVTPDGSERTAINTPDSLNRYRDLVARDDAMVLEKSTLERKVDALNAQVEALKFYLIQEQQHRAQAGDDAQKGRARSSAPLPTSGGARTLPSESKDSGPSAPLSGRVVFRVNHAVGQTTFAPTDALQANLLKAAHEASSIVIRGRTDAESADAVETRIARDRALQARAYLIGHGIEPSRIRTWYRAAGGYVADNTGAAGRALNRRVEIELRGLNAAAVTAAESGIRAASTL